MRLKIVFEPSDDGGYTAVVPALHGCISEGDTLDEARANIREAIELYLEAPDANDDGELPHGTVIEEVVVGARAGWKPAPRFWATPRVWAGCREV